MESGGNLTEEKKMELAIQADSVRSAVKRVNGPLFPFGRQVFKPGYLTGRNEYMAILAALDSMGITATRSPCGHDHNCNGDLYKLKVKED